MHSKVIRWFTDSAGALLLALAMAMFIGNTDGSMWVPPHDPLLVISMPVVFWIVGALELAVGLVCLFGKRAWLKTTLTLWLAVTFLAYEFGLFWAAGPRSFAGYMGNLASAFHVTPGTAFWILTMAFVYLLSGSVVSLLWPCVHSPRFNSEAHKPRE